MILADDSLTALTGALADTGYSDLPLWMTEGAGEFVDNYGAISWRNSTHWYAMRMLTYEVYGIPLERQCQFYMASDGFDYPTFIRVGSDRSVAPVWSMWRGFIERVANASKPRRLEMPPAAAKLFFGSVYTSPSDKVIVLMTAGQPSGSIELLIGAGVAFTVYDWAGNKVRSGTADASGHFTVQVGDLPTYAVCPLVAATVAVVNANSNLAAVQTNLALTATAHSSSTTGSVSRINNGVMEDGLYFGSGSPIGLVPFSDTVGPTTWFALTWSEVQTIRHVLLFGPPGWQSENATTAFALSTWNGKAWVSQYTFVSGSAHSKFNMNAKWQTFTETFWDGQHNFPVVLTSPVATNGVLIAITQTSYGSDPDNAMGSPNSGSGPAACVREIEVW
jgi:hypothetical protein